MAFGSGTTQVARADVEFHAETGKFEADVRQAATIYSRSIDQMSDEALRMSVAQEKLDRAIHRFGPESIQARTAAVALRKEMAQLRHEEDRVAHSARRASNDITRVARGSIAASGAFKGLGNALFFASGAFAGGFGIIYALRTTIQAAGRAQTSVTKLSVAVRNSGIAWETNRKQILDTIDAQAKLTAFDDEELQDSFGRAIIRTKDLNEAYRLNAVAADYARASGRSLEQAMTLVLRASLGQTASLRRLGIEAQKVTTNQDRLSEAASKYGVVATFAQKKAAKAADEQATKLGIIAQLEAKLSGQSAAFAKTAEGRQQRFNKVLEDTQELIGIALLPTVNRLLTQFTEWLDKMNRTGETQKTVNKILHDTGQIAKVVAGFFREVRDILGPVNRLFGGTYETTKLLIELWAAWKIVKIATAVRGIATAWGLVGPAATRAATTTVAAETAIGTGATAQIPKIVALRTALMSLGGRSVLAALGIGGGLAAAGTAGLLAAAEIDKRVLSPDMKAQVNRVVRSMLEQGPKQWKQFWANMSPSMRQAVAKELRRLNRYDILAAVGAANVGGPGLPGGDREGRLGPRTKIETHDPNEPPTGTPRPPRTEVDISLDLSRAQAQGNEAAEVKYHRELAALYQRQVNNLERRKNLTLLQKQKLTQLYGQIESEESAIEGIRSGQASEARARSQARATAAREHHERVKERLATQEERLENALLRAAAKEGLKDDNEAARALIAFYRAAAHNAELTAKERQQYEKKRLQVRAKVRAARAEGLEKRLDLREQKLRNAVDAAALTDAIKDDQKALKNLIAFYRAQERNRDLSEKARNEAERKRIAAQNKLKKLKGDDAKKGGVQSGAEFLAGLQGTLNTYGGNLFAPGELSVGGRGGGNSALTAHSIVQTSLLRDQNRILGNLAQGVRTPASSQGYTNMTSLFDGYAVA